MSQEQSTGQQLIARLLSARDQVDAFRFELSHLLAEISTHLKAQFNKSEATDMGLLCRDLHEALDELKKEATAREVLAGARIAATITQESLSNPNVQLSVSGQYGTATADTKIEAILPKKGDAAYSNLLAYFGATPKMVDDGYLKPDWKAIQEHINMLSGDGKKLPPGCDKTYPRFYCRFRRKNRS